MLGKFSKIPTCQISVPLILNSTLLYLECKWSGVADADQVPGATSRAVRTAVIWGLGMIILVLPFFENLVFVVITFQMYGVAIRCRCYRCQLRKNKMLYRFSNAYWSGVSLIIAINL